MTINAWAVGQAGSLCASLAMVMTTNAYPSTNRPTGRQQTISHTLVAHTVQTAPQQPYRILCAPLQQKAATMNGRTSWIPRPQAPDRPVNVRPATHTHTLGPPGVCLAPDSKPEIIPTALCVQCTSPGVTRIHHSSRAVFLATVSHPSASGSRQHSSSGYIS